MKKFDKIQEIIQNTNFDLINKKRNFMLENNNLSEDQFNTRLEILIFDLEQTLKYYTKELEDLK
jgi:hypothetical protein